MGELCPFLGSYSCAGPWSAPRLSPLDPAFAAALFIDIGFGFALERAGFGSSRRLAGIFYLKDMAVLKVVFTAVIVAMIGLGIATPLWSASRSRSGE